jgi:hypothetical protein
MAFKPSGLGLKLSFLIFPTKMPENYLTDVILLKEQSHDRYSGLSN